ncbi:hypothetical protein Pcinc_011970 [Petrolisthes cinctipes]|nr:hypothetical protein Pcinc_011970 [Petrolisthes cinctipes]
MGLNTLFEEVESDIEVRPTKISGADCEAEVLADLVVEKEDLMKDEDSDAESEEDYGEKYDDDEEEKNNNDEERSQGAYRRWTRDRCKAKWDDCIKCQRTEAEQRFNIGARDVLLNDPSPHKMVDYLKERCIWV